MADNFPITPGTGRNAATDQVTHSGDTADVQLVRPVLTTGAEGSKTVVDLTGDATNGLDVDVTRLRGLGTISSNNSSTATLGGGAAFTGTADEITDYSCATVYVISNVASATDGLSIQQSNDGSNWDILDVYTVPAATGKTFGVQCTARYLRVVYTNGGGAQASFRLQTILHAVADRTSSVRPQDARTNENDFNESLAYLSLFNGTTWDRARGDITNGADVDVTRMKPDGTNTMPSLDTAARAGFFIETNGTLTGGIVDETGASAVDARAVGGGTPHDSVNSGNPLLNGCEAIAHGTNPTAVAAGDRSKNYCNRAGIPFVVGGHPNVVTVKHANITTAVADTAIITVGGGSKIVVTGLMVTLDNASTVFPTVLIGFGAASTPTTTGVIAAHGGVPAGGGFNRGDGSGILGIGADGEDLRITTTGNATGNGLQVVVTYYTIES